MDSGGRAGLLSVRLLGFGPDMKKIKHGGRFRQSTQMFQTCEQIIPGQRALSGLSAGPVMATTASTEVRTLTTFDRAYRTVVEPFQILLPLL
jgi:hypothetical protein